MLHINHLYLNLCCAKIQFSALCRVQYWLYGFIYTSKTLSFIINLFLSHAVWMAFLEGKLICMGKAPQKEGTKCLTAKIMLLLPTKTGCS